MRKEQLVELVNTKFPHVHRLEVEMWIGRAWNTLIYDVFKIDPSNVDFFCKPYYNVSVEKDQYDEYYCTIPTQIVQLPDSADGVRRVMYNKDGITLKFVPIVRDSFSVFNELDVNKVDDSVGYATHHDKITWESAPNVDSVRMDVLPTFESYDDEEELFAPMGFDVKLIAIVEQLINGVQPENKLNS